MIPSWLVIGGITLLVSVGGFLVKPRDLKWAANLERPNWLVFEPLIPLIWTTIFTCGAISAYLVWQQEPNSLKTWLVMGLYLTLELITVSYTTVTLNTRSLTVGTIIAITGAVLSVFLTLSVLPISSWAAALLLPYVIWSPIGSYTTWQILRLNPSAE